MTPVKCTGLHLLQTALVDDCGIRGDRRFILLNRDGAPVSASKHAGFLALRMSVDDRAGLMTVRLPGGRQVTGTLPLGPVEPLDYMGMRRIEVRPVLGDWSGFLSRFAGRTVRLVRCETPGQGIDVKPVTLLTTGALRALAARLGGPVDARRFRANLVIEAAEPHAEDAWQDRQLRIGGAVLVVRGPVPRCIVTQLNPDTGANDARVIPALLGYRARVVLPDGLIPGYRMPGFAAYADVVQPGAIAVGDTVELI